jgi:hypothetical protein
LNALLRYNHFPAAALRFVVCIGHCPRYTMLTVMAIVLQVPVDRVVERVVEVEKPVIVEKIVTVEVERVVERVVDKIIEVPVERVVLKEVPVYVDRCTCSCLSRVKAHCIRIILAFMRH